MLCVLPENAVDDVTLHIHFTLIEAYCWENDIRVIKVRTKDFSIRATNSVSPLKTNEMQTSITLISVKVKYSGLENDRCSRWTGIVLCSCNLRMDPLLCVFDTDVRTSIERFSLWNRKCDVGCRSMTYLKMFAQTCLVLDAQTGATNSQICLL